MTLHENLADVFAHLANARRSMRCIGAVSDDWLCKGLVDIQFGILQDLIRDFARHQVCLVPRSVQTSQPQPTIE